MRIAIIGAGPTGIAAGRELLKQGLTDFTIFEASDDVGGTWNLHSYPGLACDVWAHSYTFSEAPNPDWTASFVEQPEIQRYLARCARQFGLASHIRLNTRIDRAKYQEDGRWKLTTAAGDSFDCEVVINAMGNQHTPRLPALEGMDSFAGESWHSTHWNHRVDLTGKHVAIVGSAAAAVQIVPEVARVAAHVYVLQRTPNWVLKRGRKPYSDFMRKLFHWLPLLPRLLRRGQGVLMGMVHEGSLLGHRRMDMMEKMGTDYRERIITDPELRDVMTPHTRFGCKRPLVSDDFYPALNRNNVSLIASGAQRIVSGGVITADGHSVAADVIVYCTGYRIQDFERIEVIGPGNCNMAEQLSATPEAFRGVAVPGFPNYFFGVGPNGVVLSVSYFKSAETNVAYIVRLIGELIENNGKTIAVDEAAHRAYNDWLKTQFGLFSWGDGACTSYYKNADGGSPFLYPGNFRTFVKQKATSGLHEYTVS